MLSRYLAALVVVACATFTCPDVARASLCTQRATYVFFGNGMFNDQDSANESYGKLESRMRQAGDLPEEDWTFDLSYNHDEGLRSIFQVFRQRSTESAGTYWQWLGSLLQAPDWFRDAALSIGARTALPIDADLRRHVDRYRTLLMEGSRVLVVAHSQGNLYANSAYAALAGDEHDLPMDAFGIVSVATPSGQLSGSNARYFTLLNDLVINLVRVRYPNTLPGNTLNNSPDSDWKHHGFIESYLNGDVSGPAIVNAALDVAWGLDWPEPQAGGGPITVSLNWNAQPDLDLHVIEPDGTHVMYGHKEGTSGYLDVDDTDGWGPEHYFVPSCVKLQAGTYRIAVNYFRGTGPVTAYLQIKAGTIVRDYVVRFTSRYYAPTARIDVAGDVDHGFTFDVNNRSWW